MEIESPQSNAGERVEWFPSPLPGQVNHAGPMETSVAMKKTALLFALLLAVPGLTAAQSQTKSNDSTAVRQRVVGTTRAANHAEKRNGNVEPNNSQQSAAPTRNSSNPINQNSTEPKWGDTAVVTRPTPNERVAPPAYSLSDKSKTIDQS